jgi:hypothetical protein
MSNGIWQMEDAIRGLCNLEDVGEERPIEVPPDPEEMPYEPSDDVLALARSRGIARDDSDGIFGIAVELDPLGTIKSHQSAYLDWVKVKRANALANAGKDVLLRQLTIDRLARLPTSELVGKLVAGAMVLPPEHRKTVLGVWGVDEDKLNELLADGVEDIHSHMRA